MQIENVCNALKRCFFCPCSDSDQFIKEYAALPDDSDTIAIKNHLWRLFDRIPSFLPELIDCIDIAAPAGIKPNIFKNWSRRVDFEINRIYSTSTYLNLPVDLLKSLCEKLNRVRPFDRELIDACSKAISDAEKRRNDIGYSVLVNGLPSPGVLFVLKRRNLSTVFIDEILDCTREKIESLYSSDHFTHFEDLPDTINSVNSILLDEFSVTAFPRAIMTLPHFYLIPVEGRSMGLPFWMKHWITLSGLKYDRTFAATGIVTRNGEILEVDRSTFDLKLEVALACGYDKIFVPAANLETSRRWRGNSRIVAVRTVNEVKTWFQVNCRESEPLHRLALRMKNQQGTEPSICGTADDYYRLLVPVVRNALESGSLAEAWRSVRTGTIKHWTFESYCSFLSAFQSVLISLNSLNIGFSERLRLWEFIAPKPFMLVQMLLSLGSLSKIDRTAAEKLYEKLIENLLNQDRNTVLAGALVRPLLQMSQFSLLNDAHFRSLYPALLWMALAEPAAAVNRLLTLHDITADEEILLHSLTEVLHETDPEEYALEGIKNKGIAARMMQTVIEKSIPGMKTFWIPVSSYRHRLANLWMSGILMQKRYGIDCTKTVFKHLRAHLEVEIPDNSIVSQMKRSLLDRFEDFYSPSTLFELLSHLKICFGNRLPHVFLPLYKSVAAAIGARPHNGRAPRILKKIIPVDKLGGSCFRLAELMRNAGEMLLGESGQRCGNVKQPFNYLAFCVNPALLFLSSLKSTCNIDSVGVWLKAMSDLPALFGDKLDITMNLQCIAHWAGKITASTGLKPPAKLPNSMKLPFLTGYFESVSDPSPDVEEAVESALLSSAAVSLVWLVRLSGYKHRFSDSIRKITRNALSEIERAGSDYLISQAQLKLALVSLCGYSEILDTSLKNKADSTAKLMISEFIACKGIGRRSRMMIMPFFFLQKNSTGEFEKIRTGMSKTGTCPAFLTAYLALIEGGKPFRRLKLDKYWSGAHWLWETEMERNIFRTVRLGFLSSRIGKRIVGEMLAEEIDDLPNAFLALEMLKV